MFDEILIVAQRELKIRIKSKVILASATFLLLIAGVSPWISNFGNSNSPQSFNGIEIAEANRYSVGLLALVLLYTIISLSSGFLAMTIIEEKSGRIMEVLISAISPKSLFLGKILGVLLFSVTQFSAVIATWILSSWLTGSPVIQEITVAEIVIYFMWFIPALLAFSFIFGGLGALISRSEDTGALQGPLSILLIASVYLAVYGLTNPAEAIVKIFCFVPPFNFFVALGQSLVSDNLNAELWLSYVVAVLFTCTTITFALSIFESNLLHSGRFTFTSLLPSRLRGQGSLISQEVMK